MTNILFETMFAHAVFKALCKSAKPTKAVHAAARTRTAAMQTGAAEESHAAMNNAGTFTPLEYYFEETFFSYPAAAAASHPIRPNPAVTAFHKHGHQYHPHTSPMGQMAPAYAYGTTQLVSTISDGLKPPGWPVFFQF